MFATHPPLNQRDKLVTLLVRFFHEVLDWERACVDVRIKNEKATGPILRRAGVGFRSVLAGCPHEPCRKDRVDYQRPKFWDIQGCR